MPPPYKPIGRCIYCGSDRYWSNPTLPGSAKLGDEHVIPAFLKGNILLREASCHDCEQLTTKFENHCALTFFEGAAPHYRIRGRKGRKKFDLYRVAISTPEGIAYKKYSREEHPRIILGIMLPPAREIHCLPKHVGPYYQRTARVTALSGQFDLSKFPPGHSYTQNRPFEPAEYLRMVAKIAHSFACAEQYMKFAPTLIDIIRGDHTQTPNYIGQSVQSFEPTEDLHFLRINHRRRTDGKVLLVVRLKLFQQHDTPVHDIVVGRL